MSGDRFFMYKAQNAVTTAVQQQRLPRIKTLTCVDCGRQAQHYDHRDYLKPLEVEPVCASCNIRRGQGLNRDRLGLERIVTYQKKRKGA